MSCLGTHFAITEREALALKSCSSDDKRIQLVFDIEERYCSSAPTYVAQSDKSWDGMHRALTDGRFAFDNGKYPLSHTVMGGERLYDRSDWIVVMKSPNEVRDVANVLQSIDEANFKARYWRIPQKDCEWDLSDDDCDYTWQWFQEVRELFKRAATENRHMLFTASQ